MSRVERFFFNSTHHDELKKAQPIIGVQFNPRGSSWTHKFDIFFLITIIYNYNNNNYYY